MRRWTAAVGAYGIAACHSAAPGPPTPTPSVHAPVPASPADASTGGSLPAAAGDAAAAPQSIVDGGAPDAVDVDLWSSGHSIDDLDAWRAAHGLPQGGLVAECAQSACGCVSFVLASVDGDFLMCHFGGIDPVSGGFETTRIGHVSGGRAPVVLEQDDSLTNDPDLMGGGTAVELDVLLHGGREIVVRERPTHAYQLMPGASEAKTQSCADALSKLKDPAGSAFRTRVQKMCVGVGRYVWNGQRFARGP
jgi:hypothetical protein